MARLKKIEKEELRQLASSGKFKQDMRGARPRKTYTIDEYIRFLTVSNAFANHAHKKFVKMTGNSFKM